ncbi:MAG TPA: hypothetical protein VJO34_11495, partial [Methylomirabilota bacterium]|nr:hypothetical protein [Methylomirabilota bacterium]
MAARNASLATLAMILSILPIAAGCGGDKSNSAPQGKGAASGPQTLSITTARVEARDVGRTTETTGSLLAWE